jgi:hypothetical protein
MPARAFRISLLLGTTTLGSFQFFCFVGRRAYTSAKSRLLTTTFIIDVTYMAFSLSHYRRRWHPFPVTCE